MSTSWVLWHWTKRFDMISGINKTSILKTDLENHKVLEELYYLKLLLMLLAVKAFNDDLFMGSCVRWYIKLLKPMIYFLNNTHSMNPDPNFWLSHDDFHTCLLPIWQSSVFPIRNSLIHSLTLFLWHQDSKLLFPISTFIFLWQ